MAKQETGRQEMIYMRVGDTMEDHGCSTRLPDGNVLRCRFTGVKEASRAIHVVIWNSLIELGML